MKVSGTKITILLMPNKWPWNKSVLTNAELPIKTVKETQTKATTLSHQKIKNWANKCSFNRGKNKSKHTKIRASSLNQALLSLKEAKKNKLREIVKKVFMDKCLQWVRLQIYRKISPCQTRATAREKRYPRVLHLTALNQSMYPLSQKTTIMTRASPISKLRRVTTRNRFDQEGNNLTANVSQEKMVKNTTITMMHNTTKKTFLRILKIQTICKISTKTSGKEPRVPPKNPGQNMIWKVIMTSSINMRRPSNRKSTRSLKPLYTKTSPGWKSIHWPSCSWVRQIWCLPYSSCITTNCKTSPHTISQ